MKVVFCTTCRGRAQHLKLTLPQNIADNPDAHFIVVNYNSGDDLMEWLHTQRHRQLSVYTLAGVDRFRMAHAKNVAHRLGILHGGEVLVNLDADNFTGEGFAYYLTQEFHKNGPDSFMWAHMVSGEMPRGINGRIAVTASQFINAGGYDENYENWGPDDKDFNRRLRRMGYTRYEIDRRFLDGVRHNDKMRFREYPEARTAVYDECNPSGNPTVTNWGHFGCGVVVRMGDETVITLSDMPTRVFGIGSHKTGTTSLAAALNTLGIGCAHWPSAHWAKSIWTEMTTEGRSTTLERTYAACDLPIPLLYKQLDEAYPGSKFILTIRNEVDWLHSVRDHWDPLKNKYRYRWDDDPFTHKIHRELYGREKFDALVMLECYRRHNTEVKEYFKRRPRDLYVLDLDTKVDWFKLCTFLGRPIPSVPYPRSNQT